MKVLHVTDASSAGVLTAVTTLVRQQSDSDLFAEVAFAYVRREDSPTAEQIRSMVGDGASVSEWSQAIGATRLLALVRGLAGAMAGHRFDIVHLHSSRAGFLGRLVGALTGNRDCTVYSPHCFSFAQTDISPLKRSAYILLEKLGSLWGSRLVLVSDSEYAVARIILPRTTAAVLPNAVDNSLLAPHRIRVDDEQAGNDGPVSSLQSRTVVHIGRIAEQKSPATFTDIIRRLNERIVAGGHTAIRADWLGEGNRALLGDDAELVNVSGWLDPHELRRRVVNADVVLFTSRGEGMPMALLEAQGLGVPIVASKVTGVVDVVEHGRTGYLAGSVGELTDHTYRILTDEALQKRMRQAARDRSAEFFDVANLACQSAEVYRRLSLGALQASDNLGALS